MLRGIADRTALSSRTDFRVFILGKISKAHFRCSEAARRSYQVIPTPYVSGCSVLRLARALFDDRVRLNLTVANQTTQTGCALDVSHLCAAPAGARLLAGTLCSAHKAHCGDHMQRRRS